MSQHTERLLCFSLTLHRTIGNDRHPVPITPKGEIFTLHYL